MPVRSPARKTQGERTAATTGALIDAAIECLVELGYANTTTWRVCEKAGLSRGAVAHHFQTRPALIAAALEELGRRRGSEMLDQAERLEAGEERIETALDLLWNWYNGPLFHAAVDVAAAARTDSSLRTCLEAVERELASRSLHGCRIMLAPGGADDASYDDLIQITLATIRGLAILPILQPAGANRVARQWLSARPKLAELLRERRRLSPG